MNNCNILMLMAGEGQRFKNGGYDTPKPYIQYMGKQIFRWALSPFIGSNHPIFFATRSDHKDFQPEWMRTSPKVVQFSHLTRGPLETALIAIKKLNFRDDEAVIITDCDISVKCEDYFKILDSLRLINKRDHAAVLYNPIKTTENKWLFLVEADKGYITDKEDIREKDSSCGGYPAVGVYYFSSVKYFKQVANWVKEFKTEGELYLSDALRMVTTDDRTVFTIPVDDFRSLGVPSDLEECNY